MSRPARRIGTALAAAALAAGVSAAAAGAAEAATLTVDHPCYYSFGRTHQSIRIVGAGFTPNAVVNLTLAGAPYHTTADAAGGFRGTIAAPAFRGARRRITLTATDGQNATSVSLNETDVKADFNPSSGAPSRLKVRFTVTGLGAVLAYLGRNPHGSLFAHYIRPNGRLRGTRQFAHLRGPCGDLTTPLTRLLPFSSEVGSWRVFLDTNRGYKKREVAQLVVGFTVRRIIVRR